MWFQFLFILKHYGQKSTPLIYQKPKDNYVTQTMLCYTVPHKFPFYPNSTEMSAQQKGKNQTRMKTQPPLQS